MLRFRIISGMGEGEGAKEVDFKLNLNRFRVIFLIRQEEEEVHSSKRISGEGEEFERVFFRKIIHICETKTNMW